MTQPGTPSTPTLTTEDMVRELWDRQQISDVMLRFGRGLDTRDWDMYAATLTDPFEVDFGDLTGRPSSAKTRGTPRCQGVPSLRLHLSVPRL